MSTTYKEEELRLFCILVKASATEKSGQHASHICPQNLNSAIPRILRIPKATIAEDSSNAIIVGARHLPEEVRASSSDCEDSIEIWMSIIVVSHVSFLEPEASLGRIQCLYS
jgi:hypothetical protein